MSKHLLFIIAIFIFTIGQAQEKTSWTATIEPQKVFIENKGQFDKTDLFRTDGGNSVISFSKTGVTYSLRKAIHPVRNEEKINRKKAENEEEEHYAKIISQAVQMQWVGANPAVEVVAGDEAPFYYTYDETGRVKAFRTLTYKSLYPNIDVTYVFHPKGGIEYSFILHPGADLSVVKMKYRGSRKVKAMMDGSIHIATRFGDIIDHAPVTFYETADNATIPSSFAKRGRTVSFNIGAYDKSQTVIVDPWTLAPTMPNSNTVFYVKTDSAGNAYLFGGDSPIRLQKYDVSGNLVWNYNTGWSTSSIWFGAANVDRSGNSYITDGTGATLRKVNPDGTFAWSNSAPGAPASAIEYWALDFNCDETQVYVGGSRHIPFGFDFNGTIFKMNMTNGAVSSYLNVVKKATNGTPETISEVRSMSSAPDGNIYYLSRDTVGFVNTATFTQTFARLSDYNFPYYMPYSNPASSGQGQNNIRVNNQFIYTTDGAVIHARDLSNGAIVKTRTIPSGNLNNNSGVAIDSCGNVYVGSQNRVHKYDANLNPITFAGVPGPVYDISIGANGDVLAAGPGYTVALAMNACAKLKAVCNTACTALTLNISNDDASCGMSNGSASVTPVNGSGPFSYSWSNGSTSSSISNLGAGNYSVTVLDGTGCSGTASATVIANNGTTATITADNTLICANDSAFICVQGTFVSYLWNNGSTTQCINARLAGNYYVTVTDNGNCTAESNHLALSVHPLPPVQISVNGDTLTAYNSNTYQWYLDGVAIAGATTETYIATTSGSYSVEVSDSNGCHAISNPVVLTVGIAEAEADRLMSVYPNPNSENVWHLQVNEQLVGSKIEIFDAEGRLVYASTIRQRLTKLELNLASGIYMLEVKTSGDVLSKKLVKL